MKLFIIVLHFGDPELTKKCLNSAIENLKFDQLLVIDNSANFASNKIKIIKNKFNLGFAGGMNVGVKYALSKGATHVLLLNNDIFIEEDFLTPLIQLFSKRKEIGIVGPAIKFKREGKTIYDLGGRMDMIFGKTKHAEANEIEMLKLIQHDSVSEADYISGCCMMIRKEVFEKIGFFDEKFFLYYEDVDFCLRAKKAGFLIFLLSSVHIYHELSGSIGRSSDLAIYHQTRSALIFAEKHLGIYRIFNFIFIVFQSMIFGRPAFLAIINYLRGKK